MKSVRPSPTLALNALAQQKKAEGVLVYNFAAGDSNLEIHPCIIEAAAKEARRKFCPYPPVEGIPSLREAVAAWMNRTHGTRYEQENVLVTCGGKFGIFLALFGLLDPGDEVIFPSPYWVSYPEIVSMVGGTPKILPTRNWKLSSQDLVSAITPRSKVLILNNACNPTGVLYTKEEVEGLLSVAKQLNLIVLSDEVYSGIVYENKEFISCGSFPEYEKNVLVVQSTSKNFGMTGWRVGFVCGSGDLIKSFSAIQGQTATGVAFASQYAALEAVRNAETVSAYVRGALQRRRDTFVSVFNSLFSTKIEPPPSAMYSFVPVKKSSTVFCEEALSLANVAIVPGVVFGTEGFVRFSYSMDGQEIVKGLQALQRAMGSYL